MYCEADCEKNEALESQFNSVFGIKRENTWNTEEKSLPDSKVVVSFAAATILKKLNGLNISKLPATDSINAKTLKNLLNPLHQYF